MKERVIKPEPGVLMGVITKKAFPGKYLYFYDGSEPFVGLPELPLNKIYSYKPDGIPEKEFEDKFFKHSLHVVYPGEVDDDDFEVFVDNNEVSFDVLE